MFLFFNHFQSRHVCTFSIAKMGAKLMMNERHDTEDLGGSEYCMESEQSIFLLMLIEG